MKIIIDASGAIFGRLCSFAGKKALEGNEVDIVNCEKAVITGRKEDIIEKYSTLRGLGKGNNPKKRPHYAKQPFKMLKLGVRGMLPDHRRGIGKEAFKRVTCYDGVPKDLAGEKMIKAGKPKHERYIELKELAAKI